MVHLKRNDLVVCISFKCPISILAYAHARSMSSIIFQAADYRVLMPNTDFLIHFGFFSVSGNWTSAEAESEWNKKCTARMIDIYAQRALDGEYYKNKGWGVQRVANDIDKQMRLKQEWYFSPREAIEYGFADAILGDDGYETIGSLLKS